MKTKNRKFIFASILSVLLLFLFFSMSPDKIENDITQLDDNSYLELKGTVRQSKGGINQETVPLDSAIIIASSDDIAYSYKMTNKKGKYTLRLPLDKKFKIEVTKQGFVTKCFEVNTKVPYEKRKAFSFSFEIDIFEDLKGLDVSVLKKPIAKISYNGLQKDFVYDEKYTSHINLSLKKMYENYYMLQKVDNDSISNSLKK